MNRRLSHLPNLLVVLVLVSLVMSFVGTGPVKAQTGTVLAITPGTSTTSTCGETVIYLSVQDVVNLNAYDVRVDFDPKAIKILEVSNLDVTEGGFLNTGFILMNVVDNAAGYFRLAMTQIAGTGKSGSGNLIKIRLRATVPGQEVHLTINEAISRLSNSSASYITYTTAGGPTGVDGIVNTTEYPGVCTTLSITPSPERACVGYPTRIYVSVNDVVDLYSYDISVSFNPGAIEITDVSNSTFLSLGLYGPYFMEDRFDNDTGTINFHNSQMSPALPKTGSGNLIRITFTPIVADQTVYMTIEEGLSMLGNWPAGVEIPKAVNTVGVIHTANCDPTAVNMLPFTATGAYRSIVLRWETTNEVNNVGFNLYRAKSVNGVRTKLNDSIIPTIFEPGSLEGSKYEYVDEALNSGYVTNGTAQSAGNSGKALRQAINGSRPYYYWLEAVDMEGNTELFGPVEARAIYK